MRFVPRLVTIAEVQHVLERHFLTVVVLLSVIAIATTGNCTEALWARQSVPADPQPNDEFRTQVAAIVQAYRGGDTTTGHKLIEQFRLPNPQDWFSEHLGSQQSADLAVRYDRLYANFAESFEHTIEAVVANRTAKLDTDIENGRGESPTNIRPGAKLSGMVSLKPADVLYCHFKITVSRDTTSWADTFVYQDGAFRFLGFGAWPFWVWQDGSEGGAPKGGSFSTPPVLIYRVDPAYPHEARSKRVEGIVVVRLLIDKQGIVKKADVVSGDPLLTEAALHAARQWRYRPGTLGGTASESEATANINFSLH